MRRPAADDSRQPPLADRPHEDRRAPTTAVLHCATVWGVMARLNPNAAFYRGRGFTLFHARGENNAVPYSPHFHDEYLICAQLRGEEQCTVTGKSHRFEAGDVVLINPHQVHTGNAGANAELEYISLYLDPEFVRQMADELEASTASPEFVHVKTPDHDGLVRSLASLLDFARTHATTGRRRRRRTRRRATDPLIPEPLPTRDPSLRAADTLTADAIVHDIAQRAFNAFSNIRTPRVQSSNRIGHRNIAQAINYIRTLDANQDPTTITLDDLAEVAGLSKFYFLRQFNRVVGMTPGAYLRTLRLCHAAKLIRATDRPIVDIALGVGFCDHPSFSRAFVRHVGLTPRQYQQMPAL
ncbi:MAG: AraC family transcriptional regulator [Myxococcales bacterium FL481]|nr:MAG: AraC family transcriptional regulator [Myxococcales bacterium FL481]